jgi:serine/threonine protein kinase
MSESGAFGSKQDYTFGQVAIRENLCTFEQVKECLDIQAKLRTLGIEPKKLGEILVDKGYLTAEQIAKVSKLQSQGTAGGQKLSIPGYELLSRIGQGAMGMVYKARQVSMDRIVAVKVLAPRYSKDHAFVERFVREARAVARLNHENIISGIDVGEVNGHHYFVMEFVDGSPVTGLMKRDGKIDEARTLQIGLQVAKALSHAHRSGIVHRDVKPENVMITAAGVAKLCDLGLAKQAKGDSGVTMDGTSVGTPNYISPEQARGEESIDIRSDIYSLGASLYHMATGTTPFSGANPMVVMTKHVTEHVEPPRKRNPALSEGFNALVLKMMQKRREDRHQDPDAVGKDIQTLLDGGKLSAPAGAAPPTTRTPLRARPSTVIHAPLAASRSPLVPLAVAGGVLVLLLGGWAILRGSSEAPSASATPPPVAAKPMLPVPPPVDAADRVRREVQAFRELIEPNLVNDQVPDRYTSPYTRIQNRIQHYRGNADFVGEKAWTTELAAFTERVNSLILQQYFEPIAVRVKGHADAGRYQQAQEELAKVRDDYKYFSREGAPVLTAVGREVEEWQGRISSALKEAYLSGLVQAEQAFRDPKRRDEAYGLLDAAADVAPADSRASLAEKRAKYLREDVGEVLKVGPSGPEAQKKAQARLTALKALHPKNPEALAVLAAVEADLSKQQVEAVTAAMSQARLLYGTSYRPAFDEAMRSRNLDLAREALAQLYLTQGPAQTAYLPTSTDLGLLRAWLDPQRTAPVDAEPLLKAAEDGLRFCAQQPAAQEMASALYADFRALVLLESLLEQAGEGAKAASKEAARFKTGFSPALSTATGAEPAPRKAGGGHALTVSAGALKKAVPLAPAGPGSLPETDIVALAQKAPGASADPRLPLKAFYLHLFAGQLAEAKGWLDQLASPEALLGTERYADRFKGVSSARDEQAAAQLFQEAWTVYHKRKDAAGGAKLFKEVAEKYANTDFMKVKVPPSNRTRLEIVDDLFGDGKPRAASSSLIDVFGQGAVRELRRGRYEVVYTFKDDREVAMFSTVSGNVAVNRTPQGVVLAGNGQWGWSVPLSGTMGIELSFRPVGDGALGLVVCGDGDRQGYLGVADFNLPGLASNDFLIRMPAQGAQILTAILAQGGTGLQQVKGQTNQAQFQRVGQRLRFTLGAGRLETDNDQYTSGRLAVAVLGGHQIVVERIRVFGEVDPAWLDAELRKGGGK